MTLHPTALHIALWNGDLKQIQKCLTRGESLETRDKRGNRALHLALKFAHRNAAAIIQCLLDAGARVRSRDLEGWKTVHHAVASNNEDILKTLIQREKEQSSTILARKMDEISPRLGGVPDFYCELFVEVSSWIPGVSRFLPTDTVKIWKKGQDIRFDITLVGFEGGTWKRGNLSFLFLGSEKKFYSLDHEENVCTNLLATSTRVERKDLDQVVEFLLSTTMMTTTLNTDNVRFERKTHWLSKTTINQDIGRWKDTHVFEMSGVEANFRIRKPTKKAKKSALSDAQAIANKALSVFTEAAEDKYCEVSIDAKVDHVVSVELSAGEKIRWKFVTESRDIAFGVKFLVSHDEENCQEVVKMDRVASHKIEQEGSYQAEVTGTVVFTWSNQYSAWRSKTLRFVIYPDLVDNETEDNDQNMSSAMGLTASVTTELVTFQDWFGCDIHELPSQLKHLCPRHNIMVYKPPTCRTISKKFSATVYMSEAFPLTVQQFLPVIEVLSRTTSTFETIKDFFSTELEEGFPVQFNFPLLPSVSATFRFDKMDLMTPDASVFDIPKEYEMHEEDVLSPRRHLEMIKKVVQTDEITLNKAEGIEKEEQQDDENQTNSCN